MSSNFRERPKIETLPLCYRRQECSPTVKDGDVRGVRVAYCRLKMVSCTIVATLRRQPMCLVPAGLKIHTDATRRTQAPLLSANAGSLFPRRRLIHLGKKLNRRILNLERGRGRRMDRARVLRRAQSVPGVLSICDQTPY